MGGKFAYSHPTAAYRSQGGLDEYHAAPPQRGHGGSVKSPKGRGLAARGALGALGSAGRRGLASRGTDRILHLAIPVVLIHLVPHHLLRAVA